VLVVTKSLLSIMLMHVSPPVSDSSKAYRGSD
jgi:hypothetical protein